MKKDNKKSQEISRIVKFLLGGGTSAAIEFITFLIFIKLFNLPVSLAALFSFILGFISSYLLNSKVVFEIDKNKSKRHRIEGIYLFALLAIINATLSTIFTPILAHHIKPFIAKIIMMVLIATWNYFIMRFYIFSSDRPLIPFKKILLQFRKPEYIYSIIALIAGLIFVFAIPPGWNPDEPQHYWRVQQITDGRIVSKVLEKHDNVQAIGGSVNTNAANFILSFGGYRGIDNPALRLPFPATDSSDAFVTQTDSSQKISLSFAGSAVYSPIVYIPQIIGVGAARIAHTSLYSGFILAKILGLLTVIITLFVSIRLIPRAKWLLLAIGLLPSTLVQATAFGGDSMTISICILFISYSLYLAFKNAPLIKKQYLLLFVLVLFLGLIKPSYYPLVLMLLSIPLVNKYERTLKKGAILLTGTLVALIPAVVWLAVTSFIQSNSNPEVNVALQKELILHNPISFVGTVLTTYLTNEQIKLYQTLIGNFIWDTAPLPIPFMSLGLIALTISFFIKDSREIDLSNYQRKTIVLLKCLALVVVLLTLLLISTALYLYFTKTGAHTIAGIQGRYFIPFLVLLGVIFGGVHLNKQFGAKLTLIIALTGCIVSALTVIAFRIYI